MIKLYLQIHAKIAVICRCIAPPANMILKMDVKTCGDKTELCRVEKWAGMLEGDGHKSDFAGLLKVSMLHYRL